MSNDTLYPFESEAQYWLLRTKLIAFLDRRSCTASDEVADEAVMRLVKRAQTHEVENVDAVAHGIVKNVFHEWLRRSGRDVGLDDEPASDSTPGLQRSRVIAETAIGGLKPTDREFLERYFIDKKKARELASQLGTSQVAVRLRVFRLKKQLRVVLDEMLTQGAATRA